MEQARLAAEFEHLQGAPYAVPVSNGTRAIVIALMAAAVAADPLGKRSFQPGGKVLVPSMTWQATLAAPIERRLAPVMIDVDPMTGVVDPSAIEHALVADVDREIVAVVLPHLYCRMVDMPAIASLCDLYGVTSIEDCAHAHGGVIRGFAAGSIADFGTWSFQSSKSISSGEGGMVTTRHAWLVDQLVSITSCGRKIGDSVPFQAGNDRLSAVQAALLRAQLRRFFDEQFPVKQDTLVELEATMAAVDGMMPMQLQPFVDHQVTYKVLGRVALAGFDGLTLTQIIDGYRHLLDCEVTRLYEPLDRTDVYQPRSDPANRWSETYYEALDPEHSDLANAHTLYNSTIAFEHAVLLDPDFPDHFGRATDVLRTRASQLAAMR
ncbi:DegT/DnrJ/EryC1/StrS family aminotransferase [Nocardia sp. NPDC056541]|uniref:DegT/DnrJ/EryC1/StrS family aminotransferase n=1 Tax=Nocardia sp. NPDC056541 TaxID=3345860 RepID=UPI00366F47B6